MFLFFVINTRNCKKTIRSSGGLTSSRYSLCIVKINTNVNVTRNGNKTKNNHNVKVIHQKID